MYPFWNTIIEPLLELAKPRVLVEVGSERGLNLKYLLAYAARHNATVHAIDPKPLFDADQWMHDNRGRLIVHRDTSLRVLPKLDAFDMICLDGDHNWYTVFHELKAIESRAAELSIPFPLILLHDIGWPWGRRDLYYDPDSIPAEHRQPFDAPKPRAKNAGYHDDFCRAKQEGGPRNGVLTAVEDFLAQTRLELELIQVPGFAGLGVLFPRQLRRRDDELARFLAGLELSSHMRRYVEHLEYYRMRRDR